MVDILYGNEFDNILEGDNRASKIYGYEGNDTIYGFGGSDGLYGGDGNDEMFGGAGNDYLNGGTGNDVVFGGSGRDFFFDGEGFDQYFGGTGRDTFYLKADDQVDYISGGRDRDVIDLSDVTELDTAYVEDNRGDGILDLFWKDLTGVWQQDQIRSIGFIKDADGAFLSVNDILVV